MKTRTDIINYYLENEIKKDKKSYLEIGVRNPLINFDLIKADIKHGVDPHPRGKCTHIMRSDEFFKSNNLKYDVIFIDGLHVYEQAYSDVNNSLASLEPNGIILMHDCNPPSKWNQRDVGKKCWNGTVWKAFVRLRCERGDLEMFVIDTDWGVGVINPRGKQKRFSCSENIYDYEVFSRHRKESLNLLTIEEFRSMKKIEGER